MSFAKPFFLTCAILLLGAVASGGAYAQTGSTFVQAIEDLPLMPGMTERHADTVSFESPAGRIVEVYAAGAVSRDAVEAFYKATLPQLGWKRSGPGMYLREGEQLKLDFPKPDKTTGTGRGVTVRFSLSPARN